jgi:polysaccharide export outer membrane protein
MKMDSTENLKRSIAAVAAIAIAACSYFGFRHPEGTRDCGLNNLSSNPQSAIRNPQSETIPESPSVAMVDPNVQLCQILGPAAPHPIWGVDSAAGGHCGEVGWDARGLIPWQEFAQGEYVGHARAPHVPEYRLREGDVLAIYYRRTREELSRPYELQVGDRIRIESLTAGTDTTVAPRGGEAATTAAGDDITRELVIQPDGTISLPLLGQVRATRRTIPSLREELETRYNEFFRVPSITVTPIAVNTKLEDLMDTVDSRAGFIGGRQISVTVTPAGDIQLPGVNSVFVQGLTLEEAKQEIDARYDATVPGVATTLVLTQRAKRFVFVVGEVGQAGRFELTAPTTAMQAVALAGGWRIGANLRQVVVFRRGPDWRLMATMLDLRGALYGRRPVPADDIWLNDSDIVLVTKTPIQQVDELIEQVFTRGVYSLVPREVIWDLDTTTAL